MNSSTKEMIIGTIALCLALLISYLVGALMMPAGNVFVRIIFGFFIMIIVPLALFILTGFIRGLGSMMLDIFTNLGNHKNE